MGPGNGFPWASLPTEIRFMILQILTQENRGLAADASVCTAWQAIIEKKSFRRLKLRSSCLNDFAHMVVRQRGHVMHIWLSMELRKYTCKNCRWENPGSWASSNEAFIYRAVLKPFSILSTWNLTDDGLTLQLNAYFPSDSEHWCQNCYFGADDEGQQAISQSGDHSQASTPNLHDPKHGWVDGQQVAAPGQSIAV